MPSVFKNAGVSVGTARTTVYTAPASTQSVIHAVYVSNIDGVNDATVDIEATVDGGTTYFHIGKAVSVPAGSTLLLDKPINLEANDILAITASTAGDIEAFVSILEKS